MIIVHFNDGSAMSVEIGSNAQSLACEHHKPNEFSADFIVMWVPPAVKGSNEP